MTRHDQCDETCTSDCGHCKGQGPPVGVAARTITHSWMSHLGYTPEQIAEYEMNNQHVRAGCDFTGDGWFCLGEDEKSLHPGYDELCEVAELVMFVLEHPALAGLLLPPGGETRQEWAVRVDEPHPKRSEKAGDYLPIPGGELVARHGPKVWSGWVPVRRTVHTGPWLPAPTEAPDA